MIKKYVHVLHPSPSNPSLHVQFTEDTSADLNFLKDGFPLTFLGDVAILTGRSDQLKVISINGGDIAEDAKLQLSPPYKLSLTDVKVVVEKS